MGIRSSLPCNAACVAPSRPPHLTDPRAPGGYHRGLPAPPEAHIQREVPRARSDAKTGPLIRTGGGDSWGGSGKGERWCSPACCFQNSQADAAGQPGQRWSGASYDQGVGTIVWQGDNASGICHFDHSWHSISNRYSNHRLSPVSGS